MGVSKDDDSEVVNTALYPEVATICVPKLLRTFYDLILLSVKGECGENENKMRAQSDKHVFIITQNFQNAEKPEISLYLFRCKDKQFLRSSKITECSFFIPQTKTDILKD